MKTYRSFIAASLMLAALAPVQMHAANNNTWIGTSGASWDITTPGNWSSPSTWADGANAIFGSGGGALINQNSPLAASSLTFTANGRTIYSGTIGNDLNLNGDVSITNNATGTSVGTSITGSGGLKYYGTGDLTLQGNTVGGQGPGAGVGPGNTYTGETYVRSGTLVLSVTNRTSAVNGNNLQNHGTEWAVSAVGGVDTGATLKLGNYYAGGQVNYQVPRGQIREDTHVIMNGGTFDGNGEDNLQNYPAITGTGYIVNSSGVARSVLKMGSPNNVSGQTVTNACIIGDPSPVFPSPINNKIAHEIDIDVGNSGNTTWYFTGANTHYGTWRIANGEIVRFTQNGGMGRANAFITPNTIRMNGANPQNRLDLNGTSQTTGGFAGNGNSTGNGGQPNALVCNDNPGTLSILTIGVADLGLNALSPITTNIGTLAFPTNITVTPGGGSTWNGAVWDNTGTGGTLGVTKIGTNVAQFIGNWNISGPLVVSNGFLNLVPGAAGNPFVPVLNGPVHLYSNGGNSFLGLVTSSGTAVIPVPALYIDGVPQTNGLYGAVGTAAAGARGVSVISNGGAPTGDVLQVHDFQPPLTYTRTPTSFTFCWPYETYKLCYQTGTGLTSTWIDYPGGDTSCVTVPISMGIPFAAFKLCPK